jgi:Integrase core domain
VRKPLRVIGANLSMSALGNCYDNAKAEAFFSTLKSECLPARQVFESKAVARRELFEYIEIYYNNQRLHSALGYQAPRRFEAEHFKKENNFFEENVAATSSQKRNEVQESKRNKWKEPSRSVGSSPFVPDYDLERSEVF